MAYCSGGDGKNEKEAKSDEWENNKYLAQTLIPDWCKFSKLIESVQKLLFESRKASIDLQLHRMKSKKIRLPTTGVVIE